MVIIALVLVAAMIVAAFFLGRFVATIMIKAPDQDGASDYIERE
ncbi:MAG: hypothetical protein ACRCUJ_01675 [Phocaeicola sp.]